MLQHTVVNLYICKLQTQVAIPIAIGMVDAFGND
jgi:hypothetical protein